MSRSIRNPDAAVDVHVRIPPGAHPAVFYRSGTLVETTSGKHSHPTGARLIQIVAEVDTASSSGSVVLGIQKNGTEFVEIEIPAGSTAPVIEEIRPILNEISMDFAAWTDNLKVEIKDPGSDAADLTVHCVFDR